MKQKRKKKNAGAFAGVLLLLGIFFSPMAAASGPEVSAQSAAMLTADTGVVLFEKDAHTQQPMASTTKMMTAL